MHASPGSQVALDHWSMWLGRSLELPNSTGALCGHADDVDVTELLAVVGAAQSMEDLKRYFDGTSEAPPFTGIRWSTWWPRPDSTWR